ncbi:myeloid-derived growth factor homolog [Dysidea avara]|uniref:myeloid-derived growth factor homolog n=1 Tax=Dysidea avara TaxID=196820 RepID=UPI0033193915
MKSFGVLVATMLLFTSSVHGEAQADFSIKPNGKLSHTEANLGDVICLFTYSAHGGTDELWKISLISAGEKEYVCTIERPSQTSYLYFHTYSASILGHSIESAEVFDNNGAVLQNEEFVIGDGAVKPISQGVNVVKIKFTAKEKSKKSKKSKKN